MADVIVFEVDCDPTLYTKVNEAPGLDPATGSGDWPAGLLSHVGGGGDGTVVVVEVRESRAAQDAWMESRLGPALGAVGLPTPRRMEWLTLLGHFTP